MLYAVPYVEMGHQSFLSKPSMVASCDMVKAESARR